MEKSYVKNLILQISILVVFVFLSLTIKQKITRPIPEFDPENDAMNFQPILVQFASFGNQRLISSLIWSHTLLFSDTNQIENETTNSWMYHRFNNISELEPYFYHVYHWGGMYLSVIKDDEDGAEKIFLKGLTLFPTDKFLTYYLGMHYMYELKDFLNAEKYLKLASKYHHPYKSLPGLIARLERTNGELSEDSYVLAFESFKIETNESIKKRYYEIAYSLKSEYDLNCLNAGQKTCPKIDLDGKPYLQTGNLWRSEKQFKLNLSLKK